MPIISAIEPQKKNKNRCNLYLDGEFFCGIESITIAKCGLKIGDEVDETTLQQAIFESEKESAFARGLSIVAKKRATKKQIVQDLSQKNFCDEVIEATVEKLSEYGYINDDEYVDCFLKYNCAEKGKNKIVFELKQRGIEESLIAEKLENWQEDEEEMLAIAKKYCRNLEKNYENKGKICRYLLSKGYQSENIYQILEKIWNN